MGTTSIEWCDSVWNPVTGCTKVSAGCKNCYAKAIHDRRHQAYLLAKQVPRTYWTPFEEVQLHPERLDRPLHWRKPQRVFVNSMGDLFHKDVPYEFIDRIFATAAMCPRHTFIVLTKRAERMYEYCMRIAASDEPIITEIGVSFGAPWSALDGRTVDCHYDEYGHLDTVDLVWPLPNVWLLVSIENQQTADERIPWLLQTPAAVRGVSAEPLLGPVILNPYLPHFCPDCWMWHSSMFCYTKNKSVVNDRLDWIVTGGESGPGARPMHVAWARGLRDQCQAAGVPFFFKQWGEWAHDYQTTPRPITQATKYSPHNWPDGSQSLRYGKRSAGRLLDGKLYNEYPER